MGVVEQVYIWSTEEATKIDKKKINKNITKERGMAHNTPENQETLSVDITKTRITKSLKFSHKKRGEKKEEITKEDGTLTMTVRVTG